MIDVKADEAVRFPEQFFKLEYKPDRVIPNITVRATKVEFRGYDLIYKLSGNLHQLGKHVAAINAELLAYCVPMQIEVTHGSIATPPDIEKPSSKSDWNFSVKIWVRSLEDIDERHSSWNNYLNRLRTDGR